MASLVIQCFVIAAVVTLSSSGANFDSSLEKQILDGLLKDYDARIRPAGARENEPVAVRTNIYLRRLGEIDDAKMEFSAQITFRQSWRDNRLNYSDHGKIRYLTLTDTDRIWKPDVFFSNENNGHFHNILMPNVLMRISPNGDILYSARISLKLSCLMDLSKYPMDGQVCSIIMTSCFPAIHCSGIDNSDLQFNNLHRRDAYTTQDIVFLWKDQEPVQVQKGLNSPGFKLNTYRTGVCTSKTNTGEYSCIKVDLSFTREFSYYLLQIYVPSMILVMLSWASFWLDQRATTARIAIWVTTLITLVIKVSAISQKFPAVSYTKAIDIWSGACYMFLYAALVELAVVAQSVISEDAKRATNGDGEDSMLKKTSMSHGNDGVAEIRAGSKSGVSMFNRFLQRHPSRSQRIDIVARFLFPALFAFFNLIYWSTYRQTSDDMGGTKY